MYTNHDDIAPNLSEAKDIYAMELGLQVWLVYEDGELVSQHPRFLGAFKPISDVKQVVFHEDSNAWEVIWRV